MSGRDNVNALRQSHDELVARVNSLTDDQLSAQSGATDWSVADVLSHMGSAAEIGLRTITEGEADRDAMPAVWDRWNAMSATEQRDGFLAADTAFVEAVEAFTDAELESRPIDTGFLPAPIPVGTLIGMRISEHALHSWDVRVAFDNDATLPDYVVAPILELLPTMAGFFAKPIGRDAEVVIVIERPTASYVLTLGQAPALRAGSADTTNRASMTGEALVRLTAGRLRAGRTPASVTVEGDVSLDDLRRVFPGY